MVCLDPADNRLLCFFIEPFLIDVALQTLINRTHPETEKFFTHVVQDHVVTCARSNLGNTITHSPCTHNSNNSFFTHLSIAIATALPPPRHNETIPRLTSRRFISNKILVNNLDPDCPIAWPNATAPPFTFTFSGSSPSSRVTANAATENASVNSTRSTSLGAQPVFLNNFRTASTGAIITNRGSTPAVAWATIRAIGSTPSSRARRNDVTTTADAPSLTPGALPAVTVPSGLNAGFSFPRSAEHTSELQY